MYIISYIDTDYTYWKTSPELDSFFVLNLEDVPDWVWQQVKDGTAEIYSPDGPKVCHRGRYYRPEGGEPLITPEWSKLDPMQDESNTW